jgi:hypothetical protein
MIEYFNRIENSPIFHFKLNEKIFNEIVNDVKSSLLKSVDISNTLVGSIHKGSEVLLKSNNEVFENIGYEFLKKTSVSNNEIENIKLYLSEAWVVQQKETDYNPLHVHSSFLSGILYINIPEFIGKPKNKNVKTCKKNEDGFLVFLNGYNFRTIKPVVGEGYIFASNVPHMVYPFTEVGERISVAWNLEANIQNQITYR